MLWRTRPRIETWTLASRHVDAGRVVFNPASGRRWRRRRSLAANVLWPRDYRRGDRYPVLYLLHGRNDAYVHWADRRVGNAAALLRDVRCFVVMPEGARGWYANWWNGGRRADPAWERHLLDELVPLVEERLPIRPGRRWRAIAGQSMGGLGAVVLASRRPDYFGSAAAFSAPLSIRRPDWRDVVDTETEDHRTIYGDPVAQEFYWAGHDPTALAANLASTRLFVSVGDGVPDPPDVVSGPLNDRIERMLRAHNEDFVAAARAAGVDLRYAPRRGSHEWPTWHRSLTEAVAWGLFEPVSDIPASWTYLTVAKGGRMWDMTFEFGREPDTLQRFSRRGQTLTAEGDGEVTVRSAALGEARLQLPGELELGG